jgi:transcriptional regulator
MPATDTHKPELLPGTLDMMILKTLSLGSHHGYGIARRIRQLSGDVLQVEEGSLYPALHRLEKDRAIQSEWRASENNRRARYYSLTARGRSRIRTDAATWQRLSTAIGKVMSASRLATGTTLLLCVFAATSALGAFASTSVSATSSSADSEVDTDRDGLSDFHESHKHLTDPEKPDSDGDGLADGEPDERREFTYTIRSVVRVMPPISDDILIDDFQDARVLERGDTFVELEVIHYPLSTAANDKPASANRRNLPAKLRPWLDPSLTNNWDEAMRADMIAALKADGIDVEGLTDREVVEQVSRWLMGRVNTINSSAYAIRFSDGRPEVLPKSLDGFRSIMVVPDGGVDDQFQRELYGRGMYEHRLCGSCTSAAIYLTTGLRAVGVPTRMVRAIPLVDASDPAQIELVRSGVTYAPIRDIILAPLESMGSSFTAHTYNEVFVGGRWQRLNYERLGQPALDRGSFGLMIHIQRYGDFSESGIADTWGNWLHKDFGSAEFPGANPYRAIEISDQFGPHSRVSPDRPRDHDRLTISRVYWLDSPESPDFLRDSGMNGGTLVAHVDEWFPEEPDGDQLKRFTQRVDRDVFLRSPGRGDVTARVVIGCTSSQDGRLAEILINIDGGRERLTPGVRYQLVPRNGTDGFAWRVLPHIRVVREGSEP